jgi:hypothetical protein
VKLGTNASDTSLEAYGGEAMRKSKVFLSGINGLKMVARTWKMMKEAVVKGVTEAMKMLKNCRISCSHIDL